MKITVKIIQVENGYVVEAEDWNRNESTAIAATLEDALRAVSQYLEPKTEMIIDRPESAT